MWILAQLSLPLASLVFDAMLWPPREDKKGELLKHRGGWVNPLPPRPCGLFSLTWAYRRRAGVVQKCKKACFFRRANPHNGAPPRPATASRRAGLESAWGDERPIVLCVECAKGRGDWGDLFRSSMVASPYANGSAARWKSKASRHGGRISLTGNGYSWGGRRGIIQ